MGCPDALPHGHSERSAHRKPACRVEACAGCEPQGLAPALMLHFAVNSLTAFPLAAHLDKGVPCRVSVRLGMFVKLVAVVMVVASLVVMLGRAEAVGQRDSGLKPVPELR